MLYKKYSRISSVAFTGFLLSLCIEILQMFGRGSTDINDLITNTVGACFGYLIFKLFSKLCRTELRSKFQANKSHDGIEVLFFIVCTLVIMITIQPLIIRILFKLG